MTQNNYPNGNGQQVNNPNIQEEDDEQSFDIKKILFSALRYWPYFILSLLLGLGGAYTVNRYTVKLYQSEITLLLNQDGTSNSGIESLMTKIGYYNPRLEFENEVIGLKSFDQSLDAIQDLDFEIEYFQIGRFKTTEIYKNNNFKVVYDTNSSQLVNVDFFLTGIVSCQGEISIFEEERARHSRDSFLTLVFIKFSFSLMILVSIASISTATSSK